MKEHWFWLGMVAACMLWYSTITLVVAVKGAYDIRSMLSRLREAARTTGADETDVLDV